MIMWRMISGSVITVRVLDSLPEVYPKVEEWVDNVVLEEGNATILTLFVCLLTVLYLRGRQRRQVVLDPLVLTWHIPSLEQ